MKLSDTVTIAAPQEAVFAALIDPAVLQACIPGCTEVATVPNNGYRVQMSIPTPLRPVGFKGVVVIDPSEGPGALTISKGQNGRLAITLEPEGERTRLSYTAEVELSGKAKLLGGRMLTGVVKRMAAGFFERLETELTRAA